MAYEQDFKRLVFKDCLTLTSEQIKVVYIAERNCMKTYLGVTLNPASAGLMTAVHISLIQVDNFSVLSCSCNSSKVLQAVLGHFPRLMSQESVSWTNMFVGIPHLSQNAAECGVTKLKKNVLGFNTNCITF